MLQVAAAAERTKVQVVVQVVLSQVQLKMHQVFLILLQLVAVVHQTQVLQIEVTKVVTQYFTIQQQLVADMVVLRTQALEVQEGLVAEVVKEDLRVQALVDRVIQVQ